MCLPCCGCVSCLPGCVCLPCCPVVWVAVWVCLIGVSCMCGGCMIDMLPDCGVVRLCVCHVLSFVCVFDRVAMCAIVWHCTVVCVCHVCVVAHVVSLW